jgi:hypothetical protein
VIAAFLGLPRTTVNNRLHAGAVQTFYFVGGRPEKDPTAPTRLDAFDAVVVLSPAQRDAGIYRE